MITLFLLAILPTTSSFVFINHKTAKLAITEVCDIFNNNEWNQKCNDCHRTLLFAGGGWGKRAKEYTPDEFAGEKGERTGFDAYELQDRSDFLNRVKADQKKFLQRKESDFLEIAKMAGITDQRGDGVDPMGTFSVDDEVFDETDNLDVSVQWGDDEGNPDDGALDPTFDSDSSITRLDGNTDIAGSLGQW